MTPPAPLPAGDFARQHAVPAGGGAAARRAMRCELRGALRSPLLAGTGVLAVLVCVAVAAAAGPPPPGWGRGGIPGETGGALRAAAAMLSSGVGIGIGFLCGVMIAAAGGGAGGWRIVLLEEPRRVRVLAIKAAAAGTAAAGIAAGTAAIVAVWWAAAGPSLLAAGAAATPPSAPPLAAVIGGPLLAVALGVAIAAAAGSLTRSPLGTVAAGGGFLALDGGVASIDLAIAGGISGGFAPLTLSYNLASAGGVFTGAAAPPAGASGIPWLWWPTLGPGIPLRPAGWAAFHLVMMAAAGLVVAAAAARRREW